MKDGLNVCTRAFSCFDLAHVFAYSGLRFINQSDASLTVHTIEKPSHVPTVAMGALWSDGVGSLYLFGGQYYEPGYPPTTPGTITLPKAENELWEFHEPSQSWELVYDTDISALRPAHGASLSVPEIQKGFYLGGWADNTTTLGLEGRVFMDQLVVFDMQTRKFGQRKIPETAYPTRIAGSLVYVPVGEEGVLLALGGCLTNLPCDPGQYVGVILI